MLQRCVPAGKLFFKIFKNNFWRILICAYLKYKQISKIFKSSLTEKFCWLDIENTNKRMSLSLFTLSAPQNVCEPQNVGFWFDVHWHLLSLFTARKLCEWIAYEYINISKSNWSFILINFSWNQGCFSKVTSEISVKFSFDWNLVHQD